MHSKWLVRPLMLHFSNEHSPTKVTHGPSNKYVCQWPPTRVCTLTDILCISSFFILLAISCTHPNNPSPLLQYPINALGHERTASSPTEPIGYILNPTVL